MKTSFKMNIHIEGLSNSLGTTRVNFPMQRVYNETFIHYYLSRKQHILLCPVFCMQLKTEYILGVLHLYSCVNKVNVYLVPC